MAKQFAFSGSGFEQEDVFGGGLLKGNARCRRPIDTRLPLHLVLRADVSGNRSMRHPNSFLEVNRIVYDLVKKYGLTLYQYANVGNHLHLLLRVPNRRVWAWFIRELTGRIAQKVQGLRGRAKGKKFWLFKPFTRVVKSWGRAFKSVRSYVEFNEWEGAGHISRKDYRTLKELRREWADPWEMTS